MAHEELRRELVVAIEGPTTVDKTLVKRALIALGGPVLWNRVETWSHPTWEPKMPAPEGHKITECEALGCNRSEPIPDSVSNRSQPVGTPG